MQSDKNVDKSEREEVLDSDAENSEEGLQWLLDMDRSEPEEKLFTITGNEYLDEGLSAFEAEVAGRPLIRGNTSSDDLSSYVAEEIVISSDSARSDIYGGSQEVQAEETASSNNDAAMAIDYSLGHQSGADQSASAVDEGSDILGLSSDDDMGEKFLSIKRVKKVTGRQPKGVEQNTGDTSTADDAVTAGDCAVDTGVQPTNNMTNAPVPKQVADPGVDAVANEIPGLPEDDIEGFGSSDAETDIAASFAALDDDEDFDNYLLASEHLSDADPDPEELTLPLDDDIGADADPRDAAIDYHEDFHAMEGFSQNSVAEVAAVIAPVLEEIVGRVAARATALGLDTDAVAVDLMLGADEQSIREGYSQGYQPVSAICTDLPEPLMSLANADPEVLFVRLLCTASDDNWNDFFSPDFSTGEVTEEPGASGADEAVRDALVGAPGPEEGFVEDIFGADFADGFGDNFEDDFSAGLTQGDAAESSDIEAAFADLSESDAELESEPEAQFEGQLEAEDEEQLVAALEAEEESVGTVAQVSLPEEFDSSSMAWCIPADIDFSYTSKSNGEIFADFLDAFIEEGSVEVEKLESIVGEWEKDVADDSHMADMSRTLHTIKGIAKGVGLQRFGTLIHNYETLLEALPQPAAGDEQMYFRIVNAWLDAVVRGIEYVTDKRVDVISELPLHASELAAAEAAEAESSRNAAAEAKAEAEAEAEAEVTAPIAEKVPEISRQKKPAVLTALEQKRDKQLADDGAKVLAAQQSVRITSKKLDLLLNLASQAQQLGVRASQNTTRSKRSSAELQGRLTSVRTHIGKIADRALLNVNARGGSASDDLDALEMDQYSELQEAASILREGVEDLADLVDVVSRQSAQIEALLKQQSSVISSISSSIQNARVVPVSRLMPGLRRIVRTVSTDLGKVVSFKVLNETGALDRDHYARLQVVLEHMVRNALDHGIEPADERLAAGKPTGGRITVDVRKSGGDYLIRLADDGRGIDADAIRESAYKKGLDVDVDELSDEEAIRLIFHKGFSTADELSEISGRGVGMDIVLTELQQIGGDITIQSAIGLGTSFEVRIPSNVSVNGALLVKAADESYAIPLNGLIAVEQVPVAAFFKAVTDGQSLRLFEADCEPAYLGTLCQGVGLPDRGFWDSFVPVIIAGSEDRHMAIAIDNVEEALELVIRSLGTQFSTVPGIAGAATTADGEAIVALDLNLLVKSAGADGIAPVVAEESEEHSNLLALVVDDSRTQRKVATSQLDTVGVETITAENGLVAIDLLNATHRLPDVVLLDVEMPVKDGIETLREIRKSRRFGHIPVIMVTSRTGAKHRALAKNAGCNAYMGKPFNFPALIEQINKLTGHALQVS